MKNLTLNTPVYYIEFGELVKSTLAEYIADYYDEFKRITIKPAYAIRRDYGSYSRDIDAFDLLDEAKAFFKTLDKDDRDACKIVRVYEVCDYDYRNEEYKLIFSFDKKKQALEYLINYALTTIGKSNDNAPFLFFNKRDAERELKELSEL